MTNKRHIILINGDDFDNIEVFELFKCTFLLSICEAIYKIIGSN